LAKDDKAVDTLGNSPEEKETFKMSSELYDEIKALVGQESPPQVAVDEVCKSMIGHWCEAMEDGNPLYTDEVYARKSKYGSIIAPPAMVQVWSMPQRWPPREGPPNFPEQIREKFNKAGFPQTIATNMNYEYHQPLFPRDRVTFTVKVGDVTPEKKTGLGTGHFLTWVFTYTNQKDELICTQSMTVLKYRAD